MEQTKWWAAALAVTLTTYTSAAQNAFQRSAHHIEYGVEAQGTVSSGDAPLWLTANKHGVSSVEGNSALLRAKVIRTTDSDSAYRWRVGYGVDAYAAVNHSSPVFLQQLYADIDYWKLRLTIGAKEHAMAFRDNELASGSQTLGINAHPHPEIRIGLPEYLNITGRKHHWAAIRGHIGYGMTTDGRFQADYTDGSANNYVRRALLHTKAGYLRLGNAEKFPLTFEGGLEMATQFGGTIYNGGTWSDTPNQSIKGGHSVKDFVDATFGLGGDATDGEGYANATGNTVGSWLFRLNYHGKGWGISAYYDHFFEDHSQMFLDYGWYDGLVGVEIHLPKNRIVDNVVYEYMKTTYQSGPVYHDHTAAVPDQISGVDNYYNHNLYVGWQHWGQALGNPLYFSPQYFHSSSLTFVGNRFKAHHLGISGTPLSSLHYRLLYTFERNLGTYAVPFAEARTENCFLAEVTFSPARLGSLRTSGWSAKAAFGLDRGDLTGNNTGFQFTLSKTGWLTR